MKIVIVLCDPIKRLISDFVHTTKTVEPHAKRVKQYKRIEGKFTSKPYTYTSLKDGLSSYS